MGKISEISISKGKTVQIGDKEWLKIEYGVKAQIDSEEEVSIAKSHIEGLIDGWLSSLAHQERPNFSLENVRNTFPQDLKDLLSFEETPAGFIIKPRQFLGLENFAKVVDIVRSLGGQYYSKGKDSHFIIPKQKA